MTTNGDGGAKQEHGGASWLQLPGHKALRQKIDRDLWALAAAAFAGTGVHLRCGAHIERPLSLGHPEENSNAHPAESCGKLDPLASSNLYRGVVALAAACTLAAAGAGTGLLLLSVRTTPARAAELPLADVASDAPTLADTRADSPADAPAVKCPHLTPVDPPWLVVGPPPPPTAELPVAPRSLERRISFWRTVWGERGDHQHLLVDERRPWVVHADIDCRDLFQSDADNDDGARDTCSKRVAKARHDVLVRLKKHWSRPATLRLFDGNRSLARTAWKNLYHVQGRKDALERATTRADAGLGIAEGTFANADVPRVYARAAIVESLWRPEALSRSGAGGVYQFMPKTGRQFLTVEDGVVDERLDPLRAAWAAATYMAKMAKTFNHDWPLVLTAYNTGPSRLQHVIKARRTHDLGKIADAGDWHEFGFDGENYYAQIAAIGRLTADDRFEVKPFTGHAVRVETALPFATLAACVDAPKDVLADANPALAEPVVDGQLPVPAGYVAHVPTIPVTTASR